MRDGDEDGGDPGSTQPALEPATRSEVTSGRLLRNTLVNGVANVSSAVSTAILTPFLLHHLGAEQYGVWLLALGMTFSSGYLALADLGLPEAAVKFIAEARATGDSRAINEVASTTTAAFTVLGLVLGVVVAALAPLLVAVFRVDAAMADTARLVFTLMALEVVVALPTTGLLAVIEGAQHYSSLRTVDVGGRLLWMFLVIAAVGHGHGVVSLALTSLAITVTKGGAAYLIARRAEPGLRVGLSLVTRATLRRTMSYGSFVGGLRLLSVVYSQMDRAIIAVVITVAAVSRYEVAFRVQSIATLVLVMSSSAVLPAAAYNAARGDVAKQRELFLRGSKYAVALVVPVTLAAFVYARALIVNWVGSDYAAMATATRLFLVLPMLSCVNQVGVTMLIGLGRARRVLVLQVVSVAVNLVASIALAFPLGVTGVVVGTVIGTAIVWIPYLHLQLQTFDVGLWEWMQRVVVPNAGGAFAQLLFGIATLAWATHLDSLAAVAIVCVLACAMNAVVFVTVGLARDERRHLMSRLLLR